MPTEQLAELARIASASGPGALLGCVALAAWWYERRQVDLLQRRLYRLAAAGLSLKDRDRE